MSLSINGNGQSIAWGTTPEAKAVPRPRPVPVPAPVPPPAPASLQYLESLQRTGRRLDAATGAVSQIQNLLQSVQQSLDKSTQNPADMNAGGRILRSAAATAEDIVANARADGLTVFAVTNMMPTPLRAVVGAYGLRQSYSQTIGVIDPPFSKAAISNARDTLSASDGVVPTLDRMATSGPQDGAGATAQLTSLSARLTGALKQLELAKKGEVDQTIATLSSTGQTLRLPFDLSA